MKGIDDRFGRRWILKYYCDVDGVKITISVNDLGMEGNENEMVPIIDHIGAKALCINPKPKQEEDSHLCNDWKLKGKRNHITIAIMAAENKLSRGN